METQNKLYYYHNDINGAPLRLTDEAGNIVWNVHYNIFGKIDKISKNEIDNPIRMQGQYEDEETGLYYNRYRYYDPNISAYVSQDPLGLGAGENVYSYVKNSFGWSDPLGLSACKNGGTSNEVEIKNKAELARTELINNTPKSKTKATAIGAYDIKTGKVAADFAGPIPDEIHPSLIEKANKIGGVGSLGVTEKNTVGVCAEFRSANKLLLDGSSIENIRFTDAVRPRTGAIIPPCDNCLSMFF